MINILIKLRLYSRSLQIVDLQVRMAQLPGRTKVRPPWATAHGNKNISCFYLGIVSGLGDLPSCVVDGEVRAILPRQDKFAHRYHLIAVLFQPVQNARQGLGGMEGGVVEEDDGAGGHPVCDPLRDGGGVVVLPVQAVPAGSGCKGLWEKGRSFFSAWYS